MEPSPTHSGMTLQVHVADMRLGRAFYTTLFQRDPDFAPHEDFVEWQVLAGAQLWWQVVGVPDEVRPLTTRVRFLVDDLRSAQRWARAELHVDPSPMTTLPGIVKFLDFEDPWGNRLGYYQDINPTGQQPEPGGSVHDPAMFTTDDTQA